MLPWPSSPECCNNEQQDTEIWKVYYLKFHWRNISVCSLSVFTKLFAHICWSNKYVFILAMNEMTKGCGSLSSVLFPPTGSTYCRNKNLDNPTDPSAQGWLTLVLKSHSACFPNIPVEWIADFLDQVCSTNQKLYMQRWFHPFGPQYFKLFILQSVL